MLFKGIKEHLVLDVSNEYQCPSLKCFEIDP